jgi:hypothetical protein
VHTFAADDQDHCQISEVKAELKRLSREMNDVGYVPNTKFVLWDVEEEEKLSNLWHHNEMLITFITLRTVFVLVGILGDSSALQAQRLLDYVLYTLKVAF